MSDDPVPLDERELLTLAGLARAMTRLDGRVTDAEQEAILSLASSVAEGIDDDTPYRGGARPEALAPPRWRALLERASDELHTEDALRRAAEAVTRQAARDAIYALLSDVAIVDAVGPGEWRALEWLALEWEIETHESRTP